MQKIKRQSIQVCLTESSTNVCAIALALLLMFLIFQTLISTKKDT